MKGRRPTPTALKLLTGNRGRRPINAKEPRGIAGVPPCPDTLNEIGREHWDHLVPILLARGVLTEADCFALERLCDVYAEVRECRDILGREGLTYATGDGSMARQHPAVAMLHDADRRLRGYLAEFGLTPATRDRAGQAAEG